MNTTALSQEPKRRSRLYYGWIIVILTFATLLVSAGIRSLPSILLVPFQEEFGWSRGGISSVISTGIFLYGLVGPFSAALLLRYGIRKVVIGALSVVAASLAITPLMTSLWQFELLWGVVSGLATGMMANVLGVTVSNLWFVKRKGLIVGLLTASAATGQLLFLPLMASMTANFGWRYAIYAAVAGVLVVLVAIAIWMRNHPYDLGIAPYGSDEIVKPTVFKGNLFLAPLQSLRLAAKSLTFWLLAGTFFFCGFSTNGLIGTHLIAACGDHGMLEVTAASLLALMGLFDLFGTTISGWLSDRFDSRWLLFWYYGLRGLSLLFLPYALDATPAMLLVFSVFYGLDWIATVPPTAKLAGQSFGKEQSGMIFGWIVVTHQIGASTAAYGAGVLRDWLGSYSQAFVIAGFTCFFASLMAIRIGRGMASKTRVVAQD
ncbi:major facilitator superfamily MFS_1 [Paenibacillus curdlanolyticus YK9]|uniref:Major facilitator superfamily MFS_1 n=1 Tax=Paenibacillus curdlanolyticus YK9 TaxID=717606 RepID=E0IFY9_9BACL|nr:MFS transporter [Paenibacillus curdlanolyticus]EFM08569.1 major facilitator superfamily MFS_1 [Paenibacillus curdlanolyticus YK9]